MSKALKKQERVGIFYDKTHQVKSQLANASLRQALGKLALKVSTLKLTNASFASFASLRQA